MTALQALSPFSLDADDMRAVVRPGVIWVVLGSAKAGQANASAATAAIQAGLTAAKTAGGGYVLVVGEVNTYVINSPLIISSNTTLEIAKGITLQKVNNAVNNHSMMHNENMATNVDVNIEIKGGVWDGNYANNNSSLVKSDPTNPLAGVQGDTNFINVTNFKFSDALFINCNGFGIQFIGSGAKFKDIRSDLPRDFIHVNGPSSNITFDGCYGYSADAFIALNAWDWHISGPTVGDISGVRIRNCYYMGSNQAGRTGILVVFLAGTRTTGTGQGVGNVRDVTIDGFAVDMTKGSVTPASAGFSFTLDYDQVQGSEFAGAGVVENIKITNGYVKCANSNNPGVSFTKTASTSPAAADGQNDITVRDVTVDKVHFDCSGGGCTGPIGTSLGGVTGLKASCITFRDCQWTPGTQIAQNNNFINWASKTQADRITVDGLQINSNSINAGLGVAAILVNTYASGQASVIDDLTVDRVTTATGYQLAGPWLLINGVVNNFRSRGNRIVGPAGGNDVQGINFLSAVAQIVNGVVSDGYFNGVKTLLYVGNGVSSTANIIFRDCNLLAITHPIFVNGAFNVDVSFIGGVLVAGANLARVVTGFAAITIDNVRLSGAGAGTINYVTSGTARLRKNDRGSLTATVVLTPQDGDLVYFAATPAYTGVNVISGTGAGLYVYRGTGTVGWVKLN